MEASGIEDTLANGAEMLDAPSASNTPVSLKATNRHHSQRTSKRDYPNSR